MTDKTRGALPVELQTPHPARCSAARPDYAEILRRHTEAMTQGRSQYFDPATGYLVFTAQYLWDRGFCCETGCRHCPYVARS
jgi:hypothetical protein